MSPTKIRILIATSERKRGGGSSECDFREAQDERSWNRYPSLIAPRREAVGALLAAINGRGHGEEVLRLSGDRLATATRTNLEFDRGPLLPVERRDRGPLISAMDPASLPPAAARRMRDETIVVCPLLGLLGLTDMVPEYRCPIGAQVPGWGSLHAYWKQHLDPVLNRLCKRRRVFSFLPNRLSALWAPKGVEEFISVQFATRKSDGGLRIENAGAGRLAGAVIRSIYEDDLSDPVTLQRWKSPAGHVYSAIDSDRPDGAWNMMFVR